MKKIPITIITCISLIVSLSGCSKKKSTEASHRRQDSLLQQKRVWLKQYALCACLKYAFDKDTAIKNDLSFSVYPELTGYMSPIIYSRIDSLSKQTALRIKPSQVADYNGRKAYMLDCINYYESKSLDSLVRKYDKELASGIWDNAK